MNSGNSENIQFSVIADNIVQTVIGFLCIFNQISLFKYWIIGPSIRMCLYSDHSLKTKHRADVSNDILAQVHLSLYMLALESWCALVVIGGEIGETGDI